MPFPPLAQPYLHRQPRTKTLDGLFEHCVKTAAQKHLEQIKTSTQWANILFGYETNSNSRAHLMTDVHDKFKIYFVGYGFRYAFNTDLIVQNYPHWFKGVQQPLSAEPTPSNISDPASIILEASCAIGREIEQANNPHNRESYRIDTWDEHAYKNKYIYAAGLKVNEYSNPHFREGLQVHIRNGNRTYIGEVIEYDYNTGTLFLTSSGRIPKYYPMYINIDNSFILKGEQNRIANFAQNKDAREFPVYKFLNKTTHQLTQLDHQPPTHETIAGLDEAQKEAFQAALDYDITFIWGPPGTGKSFTLAAIIRALFLTLERTAVCCVSNVAVDQLVNKVVDTIEYSHWSVPAGNFYRAGHTTDERIIATDFLFPNDSTTRQCREQIQQLKQQVDNLTLRDKEKYKERIIELKAQIKDLRVILKEKTDYLVKSSRVVFSTISNFVLSELLNQSEFDNLIVDEASMLALPTLLAIAGKVKKRIILVGDFQQLSPIAIVPNPMLTQNVFARCGIDLQHTTHPALRMLLNQRRSYQPIVEIINRPFYAGKLQATILTPNEITLAEPFAGKSIARLSITDGEMRFTKGGTRQNPKSAEAIFELLDKLRDTFSANTSIGIITPYKGQANMLRAMKAQRNYPMAFKDCIKIGTVHTFQGSECDIIIFDIVDCRQTIDGKKPSVGKLYGGKGGEQLLNVAVSRARAKFIVVGDIDWFINNAPGNSVTGNTLRILRACNNV